MAKGEITFYVNNKEVPHKATGVVGPVYPCVLQYGFGSCEFQLC